MRRTSMKLWSTSALAFALDCSSSRRANERPGGAAGPDRGSARAARRSGRRRRRKPMMPRRPRRAPTKLRPGTRRSSSPAFAEACSRPRPSSAIASRSSTRLSPRISASFPTSPLRRPGAHSGRAGHPRRRRSGRGPDPRPSGHQHDLQQPRNLYRREPLRRHPGLSRPAASRRWKCSSRARPI